MSMPSHLPQHAAAARDVVDILVGSWLMVNSVSVLLVAFMIANS